MAVLNRSVIGWLGEQAVDRAMLSPSGGRLIPWIPLIDAHGIDRAYSWDGVGAPWFVQMKTSSFADAEGRYRWSFRASSLPTHGRYLAILTRFDPTTNGIDDILWCMDAAAVRRLGRLEYDPSHRTEVYRLEGSPTHLDRLAPYRHARDDLWRLLVPAAELEAVPWLRLPTLHIDQGGLYEFATITELLRASHKDLLVFRPALDIHGRDLLVQLLGSSHAMYLQIKGTAVRDDGDRLLFHVQRRTFVPADDFSIALYFWEKRADDFFREFWLLPSRELHRRTADQQDPRDITIATRLDRSADQWVDCRFPIHDLAKMLRSVLDSRRLAA